MRQGGGRKWKFTEADVRQPKILSTRDRRKTTADLQAEMNASGSEYKKVSRMTLSSHLLEQGLKRRIVAKKPLLRPANIQECLRFATGLLMTRRRHAERSEFKPFGQQKSWRTFWCQTHCTHHEASGGDSIMVWGSVSILKPTVP